MRALLLVALVAGASAAPWNHVSASIASLNVHLGGREPAAYPQYNQTEHYFTGQRLDHFDPTNQATWSQRFFVIDDFWKPPHGPVILHLCGEYVCPGINPSRLYPLQLASEWGALVVTVEHRFYGKSQPFGDLAVDHLRFLSSRQALNDLAFFTEWFQSTWIDQGHGAAGNNTWITIGGSYPGAMAAWYRLKYPHLTAAAHSSSGVVQAILNFTAFDEQVAASVGTECADALRATTVAVETALAKDPTSAKAAFKAADLRDGDFFYLMADAAAESVQYGHHEAVCNALVPVARAKGDLFSAYVSFVTSFFYGTMGNAADDYNLDLLASPTVDPLAGGAGRSWWWQKCTEVAYFQVAPEQGSIRSQAVNLQYHMDACNRMFGLTALPDVQGTNDYYGGNQMAGSNIFFANGGEDPWQWAGVRQSLGPQLPARVTQCDDCAHCVELYTPQSTDSAALNQTRAMAQQYLEKWTGVGRAGARRAVDVDVVSASA